MARTTWNPEVGPLPRNKGGKHGGIDPNGGRSIPTVPVVGQKEGHIGAEPPWDGPSASTPPDLGYHKNL